MADVPDDPDAPEHQPPRRGRRGPRTRYRRWMGEHLIEFMSGGRSVQEWTREPEINIRRNTFYTWLEQYPEFAAAYEDGKWACEAWWIRTGQAGVVSRAGRSHLNTGVYAFHMKNRFGWRSEPERDGGYEDLSPEQFADRVGAALDEMDRMDQGEGLDDDGGDSEGS